jgi:phosphatidylglycerol:prolipoprotein diacylglycerol transferase
MTLSAGLLGGKAQSFPERGSISWSLDEFSRGYRYPGALLGVAVALLLGKSTLTQANSLSRLADAIAPSIGVGVAILRLGCFTYGCCYGTICELPWCLRFPMRSPPWEAHVTAGWIMQNSPNSLPIHPLQLYFAAAAIAAAAVALWVERRDHHAGQPALAFVCVDQLLKGALETLRSDSLLHVQQTSLVIGLIAGVPMLGIFIIRRMRHGYLRG